MDYAKSKELLGELEREGVQYIVFGAVALNFHGLARFTEDLDLFIRPEVDNINRLKRALHSVFDDPDIEQITAEDLLGDYPAVQYIPPQETFTSISSRASAIRLHSMISRSSACRSRI